jgi:serine/threonine protein kinase
MGVVYEAEHLITRRKVAIKLLRAELVERREVRERVLREARLMASLRSPHVVEVFDAGVGPTGSPFLVMERLVGRDLRSVLADKGTLPIDEAVHLARQVCVGLAHVHEHGIVHRDLKPANLFLAETDHGPELKILDFGVSKLDSPLEHTLTSPELVLGSPHYMAPEQLEASHSADARSDLWSVGVLLYRMISGGFPLGGQHAGDVLVSLLRDTPRRLLDVVPNLDPALSEIVSRCLERNPALRYQSARELELDLAQQAPVPTSTTAPVSEPREPTPAPALPATSVELTPPPAPSSQPAVELAIPGNAKRLRVLAVGGVALAFVLVGLSFYVGYQWRGAPTPALPVTAPIPAKSAELGPMDAPASVATTASAAPSSVATSSASVEKPASANRPRPRPVQDLYNDRL